MCSSFVLIDLLLSADKILARSKIRVICPVMGGAQNSYMILYIELISQSKHSTSHVSKI